VFRVDARYCGFAVTRRLYCTVGVGEAPGRIPSRWRMRGRIRGGGRSRLAGDRPGACMRVCWLCVCVCVVVVRFDRRVCTAQGRCPWGGGGGPPCGCEGREAASGGRPERVSWGGGGGERVGVGSVSGGWAGERERGRGGVSCVPKWVCVACRPAGWGTGSGKGLRWGDLGGRPTDESGEGVEESDGGGSEPDDPALVPSDERRVREVVELVRGARDPSAVLAAASLQLRL
jgi:hypothetical protein